MRGSRLRITIKHVARAAGVSIKTVSRVLNKERYVGVATRERVQAAVVDLNFRPSGAARSLAGRRSFQIALICDNPSPSYVYEMQSGIRERCQADGVLMIAQPYDRRSASLSGEVECLIDTTNVDGLILTPPITDHAAILDLLRRRDVRFVRVSPGTRPGLAPATFIDNARAAAAMTAHLIAQGHRRIGFIVGHESYATSAQRMNGHVAALQAAGIDLDPALVRQGSYDFASGSAAAEGLLDLPDPPSAIFASSDEMAAGALAAAHARGLKLPGDLSVAGFGDDALAKYVWPPLTTVRQPTRQLGWHAADLLLGDGDAAEQRELACEFVERASVAPLG